MGRADMNNITAYSVQGCYRHTLLVNRQGNTASTVIPINAPQLLIPRILHAINLVPANKLNQQLIKIFCTGTNNNLLWRNIHTSEMAQMIGYGLSQRCHTCCRRLSEKKLLFFANGMSEQTTPDTKGKIFRQQAVRGQIHSMRGRDCG